jgi:anti-sigma factor RsiW
MITCRELVELLFDFVADELPPERRLHIEQHLATCAPCVIYVETYRLTIRLCRKLPATPPPPQLMERLRQAMAEGPKQQPPAAGAV